MRPSDENARRRQERIRRRTARTDDFFAFSPKGEREAEFQPLFTRGEAEQRASTILASLPALPALVIEASKPAGPEVEGLENAIEKDPQLAAMAFASGGTSFFTGGVQLRNLNELIERVGAAAFRNLTLIAHFYNLFLRSLPWYGYDEKGLWRHLVGTAAASWKLGEALGFHKLGCEVLFLGGLLHDIGKPTMQGLLDQDAPPPAVASQDGRLTVLEAERRTVGLTHTELVPLILDIWGVEHSIFAMTEHHHAPQRGGTQAVQASIVQLGDLVSNEAGLGLVRDYGFSNVPMERAAGKLNLKEKAYSSVRDEVGWIVAEIAMELESAQA